jgi:hypothetical protein
MLLPLRDRNFSHYLYWVSCRSCFEIRIQILCQLGFHLRLMSIYLGQQFLRAWIFQTMSGIENNLLWSWWGTCAANGRPGDRNHSPSLEATLKAETEGYWKESSSYRPRTKCTSAKIWWEASMREWQDQGLKKNALTHLSAMNWNLSSLQTGDKFQ